MIVFQMNVCVSFTFGFEGGMWDLIVLIPIIVFLFTFHYNQPFIIIYQSIMTEILLKGRKIESSSSSSA